MGVKPECYKATVGKEAQKPRGRGNPGELDKKI